MTHDDALTPEQVRSVRRQAAFQVHGLAAAIADPADLASATNLLGATMREHLILSPTTARVLWGPSEPGTRIRLDLVTATADIFECALVDAYNRHYKP